MSTLKVDTIQKADGTGSLSVPAESGTVVTTASPSLGRRNLIINGAMQVAQRGTSAITLSNAESFGVDRFKARNQSNSGDNTIQQVSDAPAGVGSYSLKWTTGTADTAGSTDNNYVTQYIGAEDLAHLKFGTSDAQTITLSFYVKSSLTGTFGGSFSNHDLDRGYPFTYSISSASTWERKSITISGDTTGTWGTTSADAFLLWFDMGMGSSYRGTAGSWASGRLQGATGATDVIGTAGATWQITGVQLEVGSVATPFEHRSYGEELALCQRYYQIIGQTCASIGTRWSTNKIFATFPLSTALRAQPAIPTSSTFQAYRYDATESDGTATPSGILDFQANGTSINIGMDTDGGNPGVGSLYFAFNNLANPCPLDSEL